MTINKRKRLVELVSRGGFFYVGKDRLITGLLYLRFIVGPQHLNVFVLVQILQAIPGGSQVLAWIELGWFLCEDFPDRGSHRQPAIGVADFTYR
jgi:hypothetical protein